MTRTFFLVCCAGGALAAAAPRRAFAGASIAGIRVLRRRAGRGPAAGRCADGRRRLRWSGYTADDFPPSG